jgi:IclR family acetate operon transcriptional repressor
MQDGLGAPTPNPVRIQSVARAAAILLEISDTTEGLSAREVGERLHLNRTTAYHLMETLAESGLLLRGDGLRYRLGLNIGSLHDGFRRQVTAPEYLLPFARALAERTGESIYLAGRYSGDILVIGRIPGTFPVNVQPFLPGVTGKPHAHAIGKALLAFASANEQESMLGHGALEARTPSTIVDRTDLDAELAQIRDQGYAVDRDEWSSGVSSIATVLDEGASSFALALSAPSDRLTLHHKAYLDALLETAAAASSHSTGVQSIGGRRNAPPGW